MMNTNISNFRKDIHKMLESTIRYNEPINISTKDGNAVLISEAEYCGLMETLYLCSDPQMKDKILDGIKTPLSDCISESEVEW